MGFLSGISSTVFLYSLQWVTEHRQNHPEIILFLPLVGFFIGWTYWRFGHKVNRGNQLIFEEIHNPKNVVPFRMAPFVCVGTLLTHWFGGSAGREGTAVQMSASLSDQLSRYFLLSNDQDTQNQRRTLLKAGLAAGFGSAVGAPWAGFIFGLEVIRQKRKKILFDFYAWYECVVATWVGYFLTLILQAPHSKYSVVVNVDYNLKILAFVSLAGIIFGIVSWLFSYLCHRYEKLLNYWIKYPPLRPFFGGIFLILLYSVANNIQYAGLGLQSIQQGFLSPSDFLQPMNKIIFTVLTIGSGFKGGEFIPLVFVGTTLGSALGLIFPVAFQLLAVLGFAAVFAGFAKVPLTCVVMAIELFGWQVAPYALLVCYLSYFLSIGLGYYLNKD